LLIQSKIEEKAAMEDTATPTLSQEASPKETLGRRQLLKAIAATGGAVAASSLLPGEWAKPVVEVGVLPAHAQVSVAYSMLCDSEPGGGDISLTDFMITQIQPRLAVVSGSGPLEGISATMTARASQGPLPIFNPTLPQSSTTDSSGRAIFPDLTVTGQPDAHFFLVFTFDTPRGVIEAECGEFYFPPD
jgi:hypothetical protein